MSSIATETKHDQAYIKYGVRWVGPIPPPGNYQETITPWPVNYADVGLRKFVGFIKQYRGTEAWHLDTGAEVQDIEILYQMIQEGTGEWHPIHSLFPTPKQQQELDTYYKVLDVMVQKDSVAGKGVIPQDTNKGYLVMRVRSGDSNLPSEAKGKIYINPGCRLSMIPNMCVDLVVRLKAEEIDADIKLPYEGLGETNIRDPRMPFRADNIVVHFGNVDCNEILNVLKGFYHHFRDSLIGNPVPLFSLPLIFPSTPDEFGAGGQQTGARGMSFAQEEAGDSFGHARAELLSDVLQEIKDRHAVVLYEGVRRIFSSVCHRYGVDPANPAFNQWVRCSNSEVRPFYPFFALAHLGIPPVIL